MKEKESIEKVVDKFLELYKSGYRFLDEHDEDNPDYFCNKEKIDEGIYKITTIKGFKQLAKQGKLKWKGRKLSLEETDLLFNLFAFALINEHKIDWKK